MLDSRSMVIRDCVCFGLMLSPLGEILMHAFQGWSRRSRQPCQKKHPQLWQKNNQNFQQG